MGTRKREREANGDPKRIPEVASHREERRILGGERKAKRRAKKLQKLQEPPKETSKKSKLFNRSQKRDCSPIVEKSEFSSSVSLGSVKTRREWERESGGGRDGGREREEIRGRSDGGRSSGQPSLRVSRRRPTDRPTDCSSLDCPARKIKKLPKTFSQVLFPGDNQPPGPKPRTLAFLRSFLQVTTNPPGPKPRPFLRSFFPGDNHPVGPKQGPLFSGPFPRWQTHQDLAWLLRHVPCLKTYWRLWRLSSQPLPLLPVHTWPTPCCSRMAV